MTFRKDEIQIGSDITEEEAADFVTFDCPACGHPEHFHPAMVAPDDAVIWCAECAHPFGTWPELRARLFPGAAMLAETLSKQP